MTSRRGRRSSTYVKLQRLQITQNKGQEGQKKSTTMLSVDVTIPVICLILLMISACEKAEDDLIRWDSRKKEARDETLAVHSSGLKLSQDEHTINDLLPSRGRLEDHQREEHGRH